jgi:PAS domain S-box-containing protein
VKRNKADSDEFADLRKQAEKALRGKSGELSDISPEDMPRVIHELQVHRLELEMQNEELRRIRHELEDSRDRYSDLYNFAPVGYFTVSEEGLILGMNLTGANLLCMERGLLIGEPLSRFIARDDQDVFRLHRSQVLETRARQTCEVKMVKRDDTQFYAELESIAIQDYHGNFSRYRTVVIDVTERKRAEEASRLKTLFDNASDAIFIHDLEGRFLEVNQVACERLGYSREELLQMTLTDIESPEYAVLMWERIEELHQRGRAFFETAHVRRDGTIIPIELSSRAIEYADDPAVLSIARDVTERKRMQQELLKAQKLESIGILAGGIAHDFNNILTAILGNVSLAKMYLEAGEETDKVIERLAEADRASMRAKDLTQRLLTFSKGGAPIKALASVEELLRDSVAFALRGSNVGCEFSIPDDLWPVEVDEGQVSQVINNLVINADQAMPEGGVIRVSAENVILEAGEVITVSTEDVVLWAEHSPPLEDGEYVKISIQDGGIGISQEHLERVFDPYFTTKQRGSGLGLTTSYSIIKNHGGHITVESQVGVGTAVHFYLPAFPERTPTKENREENLIMGEGRILVMDDEEAIGELASEMLGRLGYEVTTAIDGAEVIELYKEAKDSGQPYDAVIIDLTVPGGMGGKKTIRELMKIDPEVKAIVSSGYSKDPIMADFREYGFTGVIAKPYKTKELSEVLHRAVMDEE